MAKTNKAKANKKRKNKQASAGTPMLGIDLLRETLGNFLGNLMADSVQAAAGKYAQGAGGNGRGTALPPPPPAADVAAILLQALAEHGPKSIPELMELTGMGLSPMLAALRSVQKFRLVEFVEEGGVVQLTASGNQTVTVIRKDEPSTSAVGLLEE